MPVQFVLGRAGTGKTHWCFQQILQRLAEQPIGPAIYWLLPRQATFQAQRQLACTGGRGGFFRVRVLSFEELEDDLLQQVGGAAANVSDLGRQMILGHLLRQNSEQLQFFSSVAHQPGVAAEINSTFTQLERCGQDPDSLQNLANGSNDVFPDSLSAKLHDLQLIFSQYAKFLGQDRLDPSRRLGIALQAIQNCKSLRESEIFVDSFYEFTPFERRILAELGKVCRLVNVTLIIDPTSPSVLDPIFRLNELSLFHKTELAYRKLSFELSKQNVSVAEQVKLDRSHRYRSQALADVERWNPHPGPPPEYQGRGKDGIRLIEAPDRAAEVDAVARWINDLVASESSVSDQSPWRFRDIAVLMRTDEDYYQLIESSFREHGIPFFIDRRRSASHHPLLRLIRAAIAIAAKNWSLDAVIAALKTGLLGLNHEESDALENYCLLHGISGKVWLNAQPWSGRRRLRDESGESDAAVTDVEQIDELRRRIVEKIQPFVRAIMAAETSSVHHLASAVFQFLENVQAREQLVQWMNAAVEKNRLEERGEHDRVWGEVVKLFDEMVQLFGDEEITLDDFSQILETAMEGFTLALTPPTVDQVLVGAVDRTRTPDIRACAVLGLNEGQFPRASHEGTVFGDADLKLLSDRNVDLEPDTRRKLLDEQFLGYLAFTRSSDRLLLTRALMDSDDRAAAPSPLWQRIASCFPDLKIERIERISPLKLDQISTPRQLISALMQWAREGGNASSMQAPVYQWLARHPMGTGDAIDLIRGRAWKALLAKNEANLSEQESAALFRSPLTVNARELESFRACPFQHFAKYGLRLHPRQMREITAGDLARVYREVLNRIVRQMIQAGQSWNDLDEESLVGIISETTWQFGIDFRGELMLSTARNRYLLDRIAKTLGHVVRTHQEMEKLGEFRLGWTNLRFAEQPGALQAILVETGKGNRFILEGKIDRVDRTEGGTTCAIDYRLSASPWTPWKVYHGISLHLFTMILFLESGGYGLTEEPFKPAGAIHLPLLRKVLPRDPTDAPWPDEPKFHLNSKPRGFLEVEAARKFDPGTSQGHSQVVQYHINKEGGIGFTNISDAVESRDFSLLLDHVKDLTVKLVDRIIGGEIGIHPYWVAKNTPCSGCQFHDVCRFEPRAGGYVNLEIMNRGELWNRLSEEKPK